MGVHCTLFSCSQSKGGLPVPLLGVLQSQTFQLV